MTRATKRQKTKWMLAAKQAREACANQLNVDLANPSEARRFIASAAFLRAKIPRDRLDEEADFSLTCWPEYGYLRPLERTQRFAADYLKIYRQKYGQYVDYSNAEGQAPISEDLAANVDAEISALFRARQVADAGGLEYAWYIRTVMEHAATEEGHTRLLRPNQLYHHKQVDHALSEWERLRATTMLSDIASWGPRFLAADYRGDDPQRHLHRLLAEKIKGSALNLSNYMRPTSHVFPVDVARAMFGNPLVDEAIDLVGSVPNYTTPEPREVLPHCAGLSLDNLVACRTCPMIDVCRRLTIEVERKLVVTYGSADPRLDHKRTLDRERQRKRRRKQRSAAMLAEPDACKVAG